VICGVANYNLNKITAFLKLILSARIRNRIRAGWASGQEQAEPVHFERSPISLAISLDQYFSLLVELMEAFIRVALLRALSPIPLGYVFFMDS